MCALLNQTASVEYTIMPGAWSNVLFPHVTSKDRSCLPWLLRQDRDTLIMLQLIVSTQNDKQLALLTKEHEVQHPVRSLT